MFGGQNRVELIHPLNGPCIYVTSFSSILHYSNVRLISKIELEQSFQSITLDVHASANERPPRPSLFQARQHKQISRHFVIGHGRSVDLQPVLLDIVGPWIYALR